MHNKILTLDIETYSSLDIGTVGAYRYAQAPDFRVLLCSYALDGGPVNSLDTVNDCDLAFFEGDFREMLFDPHVIKRAHNATFEWWCLSQYFGLSQTEREAWLGQWQDTMVHMLYCGLPASLDAAGKALGLPEDKAKLRVGRQLIGIFCKPDKTGRRRTASDDPERWRLFCEYNAQDVVAERELERRTAAWPVPETIWAEWRADVIANSRGIGVDMQMVDGALTIAYTMSAAHTDEARQLTGLGNPNSITQLRDWILQQGVAVPDLRKETVAQLLAQDDLPPDARRALELRQMTGKSSVKKYDALRDATGQDGRIRGCLQFYGAARTGRWAGRLVQVQNLPRTYIPATEQADVRQIIRLGDGASLEALYGDANDVLSQMIRTAFVPQPGGSFVDADFSAIEARLIAWEAGEDWVLEVFRTTGKIYEATAARIFGVAFETIVKGHPNYAFRQRGKVATLALGYQGGVGAMKRMGGDKLGLDDAGLQDIVNRWRGQNPRICRLWRKMQDAAVQCIETGSTQRVAGGAGVLCSFRLEASSAAPFPFLTMQLPSGRKLFYARPGRTEDGRITYWEQESGSWKQAETYGGKLTENLTQACGRDVLAFALRNLRAAGYSVTFHVHDEVVIDLPPREDPQQALADVIEIMRRVPPWAEGLPLNADGWTGQFFTKD